MPQGKVLPAEVDARESYNKESTSDGGAMGDTRYTIYDDGLCYPQGGLSQL